jgi:hypothetical protein
MEKEEHLLCSINDFIAVATDENIDRLMRDFRNHIQLQRHRAEIMGLDETYSHSNTFEWLDDGAHHVYIDLRRNEWAPRCPVGRVTTTRPAIFGADTLVIFRINETGASLEAAEDESWIEAIAAHLRRCHQDTETRKDQNQ